MNFSAADYRRHVGTLTEALQEVCGPRVAEIEEGDLHVSFHVDAVGPDWWDVGARGSCAYAVITEIQPEELLRGRPPTTLRRSNIVPIHSWVIYFFPDGERIYVAQRDVLPECYRNAITDWLRVFLRNQAAGGGDCDPSEPPISSERDDFWGNGGHALSGPAQSR